MKNFLINFILSPRLLTGLWIIFLSLPLLLVMRYASLNHVVFFSGIRIPISLIYLIIPYLLMAILIVLVTWVMRFNARTLPQGHKKTLIFMSATSLIYLLISNFLLSLELNSYMNYLYTKTGIPYDLLKFMTDYNKIALIISAIFLLKKTLFSQAKKNTIVDFPIAQITITFLGLVFLIFGAIFVPLNLRHLYRQSQLDYKDKLSDQYEYVPYIIKVVPEKSRFIHPPQNSTWGFIGNQPTLRYFLFPRTLISGALIENQKIASEISTAYFIEIEPGSADTHWPLLDLTSKYVIFDQKTKIYFKKIEKVLSENEVIIYKIVF